MRFRNMVWAVALFFAISLSTVTFAAVPQPAAPQAGMGQGKMGGKEGHERHPEIRKAIAQLKRAKADLQAASHDFGGHREAALKACDDAIAQLQQALQYDKK
jgi:hypothetical protein